MKTILNCYFKVPTNGPLLLSGLPLPAANDGPYRFVNCQFHPVLDKELANNYAESVYIHCEGPYPVRT